VVQRLCRGQLQAVMPVRLRMQLRQLTSGKAFCKQAAETDISPADLFHAGIQPECRVHDAPLALAPGAGGDVSGSALDVGCCSRVGLALRLLALGRRQPCSRQALSMRCGLLSAAMSHSLHEFNSHVRKRLSFPHTIEGSKPSR
jgi:hypothetical protein